MSVEQFLHRLKSPRERDYALFLGVEMVKKIGYVSWELYQTQEHICAMQIFDDFTFHLENQNPPRPNLAAELEARRLLTVELSIQFADFITEVFNLSAANMVQNANPNNNQNNN